jgi:hypothetical protein
MLIVPHFIYFILQRFELFFKTTNVYFPSLLASLKSLDILFKLSLLDVKILYKILRLLFTLPQWKILFLKFTWSGLKIIELFL